MSSANRPRGRPPRNSGRTTSWRGNPPLNYTLRVRERPSMLMTPTCLTRRGALVSTIVTPLLALPFAAAAEPAGTVEALRGEATAQAGSGIRPLAQNASVLVGDLVATGAQSAVALRLGSATQVRLGPEARLRIDRFLV